MSRITHRFALVLSNLFYGSINATYDAAHAVQNAVIPRLPLKLQDRFFIWANAHHVKVLRKRARKFDARYVKLQRKARSVNERYWRVSAAIYRGLDNQTGYLKGIKQRDVVAAQQAIDKLKASIPVIQEEALLEAARLREEADLLAPAAEQDIAEAKDQIKKLQAERLAAVNARNAIK